MAKLPGNTREGFLGMPNMGLQQVPKHSVVEVFFKKAGKWVSSEDAYEADSQSSLEALCLKALLEPESGVHHTEGAIYPAGLDKDCADTVFTQKGKPWSDESQLLLLALWLTGCRNLPELCQSLQRTPSGVISMLSSLKALRYEGGYGRVYVHRVLPNELPRRTLKALMLDYKGFRPETKEILLQVQKPETKKISLQAQALFRTCAAAQDRLQAQKLSINQPKEFTMDIKLSTKTFIGGIDASQYSDEDLFKQIKAKEDEVKKLEAIENKPKKLQAKIEEAKADIDALVKFIDERK